MIDTSHPLRKVLVGALAHLGEIRTKQLHARTLESQDWWRRAGDDLADAIEETMALYPKETEGIVRPR